MQDEDAGKSAAGLMVGPKGKSIVEQEVQIVGERKNSSVNVVPKADGGRTRIKRKFKTIGGASKSDFQILDPARIGEALIAQKPFDDPAGGISTCSHSGLWYFINDIKGYERKYKLAVRFLDYRKLADLVARGEDACQFSNDGSPMNMLVMVNMKTMQMGSFKVAYKAFCNYVLPDFNSPIVCAKQAFEDDGQRTALPRPKKVKLPDYDKHVSMLKTELKTLAWASALLDNVYAFIKKKKPNAQFDIPQFRFVRAALGEDRKKDQGPKRQAFLIEEYIDETSEGEFTKYINNGIAKPLGATVRVSDTYRRRAEFLCFTQHVQYVISGKTAYVSDYQGTL